MPPRFSSRIDAPSRVQLLSNGHYTVMLNAAGSGYSQWKGFAVTRWREDPVGDGWGSYPCLKTTMDRLVVRIRLRKHLPLGTRVEDPQHCIKHLSCRHWLAARSPIRDVFFREVGFDPFPVRV